MAGTFQRLGRRPLRDHPASTMAQSGMEEGKAGANRQIDQQRRDAAAEQHIR